MTFDNSRNCNIKCYVNTSFVVLCFDVVMATDNKIDILRIVRRRAHA